MSGITTRLSPQEKPAIHHRKNKDCAVGSSSHPVRSHPPRAKPRNGSSRNKSRPPVMIVKHPTNSQARSPLDAVFVIVAAIGFASTAVSVFASNNSTREHKTEKAATPIPALMLAWVKTVGTNTHPRRLSVQLLVSDIKPSASIPPVEC